MDSMRFGDQFLVGEGVTVFIQKCEIAGKKCDQSAGPDAQCGGSSKDTKVGAPASDGLCVLTTHSHVSL
jgi:hypothetical protein